MTVDVEESENIVTIRLNRPDSLNAFNEELMTDLYEAVDQETRDPAKALMLTGAGRATCAGMDTSLVSQPNYREEYSHLGEMNAECREMIAGYPLPTAMAAKGAVAGAGFGFSLHHDLVVAGEDTHLSYPEIEYDLVVTGASELEEIVGPRIAKEIVLTADPIDPARALEVGLVNDVVPESEVEDATRAYLDRIMEHDPETISSVLDQF